MLVSSLIYLVTKKESTAKNCTSVCIGLRRGKLFISSLFSNRIQHGEVSVKDSIFKRLKEWQSLPTWALRIICVLNLSLLSFNVIAGGCMRSQILLCATIFATQLISLLLTLKSKTYMVRERKPSLTLFKRE